MADLTFKDANTLRGVTVPSSDALIPFTHDPDGTADDYAAPFSEISTGAGYPGLDENGNLVASVALRQATIDTLWAASDMADGEVAVPSDLDAVLVNRTSAEKRIITGSGYMLHVQGNTSFAPGVNIATFSTANTACFPAGAVLPGDQTEILIQDWMKTPEENGSLRCDVYCGLGGFGFAAGAELKLNLEGFITGAWQSLFQTDDVRQIKGTEAGTVIVMNGTQTCMIAAANITNLEKLRVTVENTGANGATPLNGNSIYVTLTSLSNV